MWNAVKKFFTFFFSVEEVNKIEREVKNIETKVDAEINKKVDEIVELGKKIEEKIDEEVKVVKTKAKAAATKAKAAVKKPAGKKNK